MFSKNVWDAVFHTMNEGGERGKKVVNEICSLFIF